MAPVGLLAGLLGSDFSALARRTAPALLEKGADKKAVVAEAVRGCLAALSTGSCLTLAEAAELALAAMSRSTNTQLRSTAARWLAAAVSAADAEGVGRALDALDAPLQLLEEDATAEVYAPPPTPSYPSPHHHIPHHPPGPPLASSRYAPSGSRLRRPSAESCPRRPQARGSARCRPSEPSASERRSAVGVAAARRRLLPPSGRQARRRL